MTNRREDMAFFRDNGMRTIMAREVSELGTTVGREAVRHATSGVDRLWLAVDLDVLDKHRDARWDWPIRMACAPPMCWRRPRRRAKREAVRTIADDDRRQCLLSAAAGLLDRAVLSGRVRLGARSSRQLHCLQLHACDWSVTVSRSGQRTAAMRWRRSTRSVGCVKDGGEPRMTLHIVTEFLLVGQLVMDRKSPIRGGRRVSAQRRGQMGIHISVKLICECPSTS